MKIFLLKRDEENSGLWAYHIVESNSYIFSRFRENWENSGSKFWTKNIVETRFCSLQLSLMPTRK